MQLDSFDLYQYWTESTAVYPRTTKLEALSYVSLGLAGEAGEVANKVKKLIRRDSELDVNPNTGEITCAAAAKIMDEAGDVLYYLARLCSELEMPMSDVVRWNMGKLERRKAEGTIKGGGDHRGAEAASVEAAVMASRKRLKGE